MTIAPATVVRAAVDTMVGAAVVAAVTTAAEVAVAVAHHTSARTQQNIDSGKDGRAPMVTGLSSSVGSGPRRLHSLKKAELSVIAIAIGRK
jgi:hypothetical protein